MENRFAWRLCTFLCVFCALVLPLSAGSENHSQSEGVPTEQMATPSAPHDHSAHGGHHDHDEHYKQTIQWLGNFHPVAVHFPIALIVMTCIAELLFFFSRSEMYQHSARFMVYATPIFTLPAVLFGLAYGYGVSYEPPLANIFWWHRALGITILVISSLTAVLKYQDSRSPRLKPWYFSLLTISAILVGVTGYLGGELTFGLYHFFK